MMKKILFLLLFAQFAFEATAQHLGATSITLGGEVRRKWNQFYSQSSAPSGTLSEGDLWVKTGTDSTFAYNGSSWVFFAIRAGSSGLTNGDKGDVIFSGSPAGSTITIDAGAVNSSKIQDGTIALGDLAFTPLTSEVDGSTTNELTTFTSASTAPGSPKVGDIWHKSTTDSVFIRTSAPAWAFLAVRAASGGGGTIAKTGVPTVWNTESLSPVKVVMDSLYRGATKKIRVLSIGDSNTNHQSFNAYINDLFAAEYDTIALGLMVPACDVPSGFTQAISATQVTTDPESVCRIKWYFDATSDSIRLEYLPGSVANRNFNKARFFIQKRPNGGQLRFRIGYGTTVVYDQTVNTANASVSDSILTTGLLSIPANVTAYVRITCPATGAGGTYLHGYFLENTTDYGYEGVRLGMNGYSAETYSDVIPTRTFKRFIQSISPEIVTISLGTNDIGFTGANNNITYFKTKITLYIDSLRSYLPGVPIWLISPGDTRNEASPSFTAEMIDTCMFGIAQRKQCAFMSIRQLMGDTTAIDLNGYYSDNSHYSVLGQRLIANTMYEAYGWVRPYSVPPSQTPSIVRAANNNNQAKIQNNASADRWTFDFASNAHTVTVQDTGIVRFNTPGFYPIQQLSSGVTYRGLIGMPAVDVIGLGDGKLRVPMGAAGSSVWPASGAAISLGDTTVQNSGGVTMWATNQGSMLNLHRLGSPSTWVLGDDINSFTLNRSGSGAQFGLHRNAPASSLMVDSDGSVVFGNTASAYHVGIVGTLGTVGLGITGLNTANDNGIYMTGTVTGNMQVLNNDISATGNVVSTVKNTNNANSAANAYQDITSGGASGGDPGLRLTVTGAVNVTLGIDNSNSDVFGIQPYASNNTIAHGIFMETSSSGEAGVNITAPAVTWDVRSRSDQLTAVSSLANTTVTTPLKQFALNAAPESTVTGAPGDFAFANISSAGRWFGKTTGNGNTGWAEFLHTLNGFANDGNSFSTNATLGTNNTRPLSFETNGTRRMSIPSSGIASTTTATKALMLSSNDSLQFKILDQGGWSGAVTQSGTDTLLNGAIGYGHLTRVGDIVTFTLRIEVALTNSGNTNTVYISPPVTSNFITDKTDVIGVAKLDPQGLTNANTVNQMALLFASTSDDKIGVSFDPPSGLTFPNNRMYVNVSGSYIVQ